MLRRNRYFTQETILGKCAQALPSEYEPTSNLSAAYIATHGATLEEWSTYLQCFAPVQVETTYAGEATAAAFRMAVNASTPHSSESAVCDCSTVCGV